MIGMLNFLLVTHIFILLFINNYCFCSVPDLITSNIKQKTEIGMHARDLLVRGEAVPDQMVARMLDIKMRSPEVAHHGL
jgi:adenylate kinase family enzyme